MSILRTRTPQAVPATAATLEPFRLMRDFLRWDPLLDYGPGAPTAFSRLTVAGKRDEESMKEGERIHLSERSHGSFSRTFTLPEDVEGEKVVAELRNGVLTLMVPKRPEVRPRKINVSLG